VVPRVGRRELAGEQASDRRRPSVRRFDPGDDRVDGDRRGDLAGPVAAEPVGDDKDAGSGAVRVLVVGAGSPTSVAACE
jgi:hypothetical protein